MGDLVLGAEADYLLAGKVRSVVGDGVEEPEATHYVLLEELDNQLFGDFGEWYRLGSICCSRWLPAGTTTEAVLGGVVQLRLTFIA